MENKNILWLKDIKKEHLPYVGGKGSNLGHMFQHFQVPNGFCVTVKAYQDFLEKEGIRDSIYAHLANLDVEDTKKLDRASEKIRALIVSKDMPKDLKKEILHNYAQLPNQSVAVRSSATAEDLPTASFAGQQDTYLNILGEQKVAEAIKKCWASLFTSRAIYYREKNKFRHEDVAISVVVQEMIHADFAGVMFTVDPIHKRYVLIEVVEGLGESLVSGQITPNSYFLNNNTGDIVEEHLSFEFPPAKLKEIARLGKRIAKHFKHPQDIEFCIKDGKVFVVQSRNITTL